MYNIVNTETLTVVVNVNDILQLNMNVVSNSSNIISTGLLN